MIVDFHAHYYPKRYLRILEESSEGPRLVESGEGKKLIVSPSFRSPLTPAMADIGEHLRDMDAHGVDLEVLSLANPWDEGISAERWVEVAEAANDGIAEAVRACPERFAGLATLPYKDVGRALEELDRAVNSLGMRGISIPTRVDGKRLDAKEFWPLYEKLARYDLPMFIHPTAPAGFDSVAEPALSLTVGFPFETTLTVTRMVLNGVLERFPALKVVAAHLGGALPHLVGRISRGARMHAAGMAPEKAAELLRRVHLDTAAFHLPALTCAYEFYGSEKLLLGSDYPYAWCDRTEAQSDVQSLNIPAQAKARILAGNAAEILKLGAR